MTTRLLFTMELRCSAQCSVLWCGRCVHWTSRNTVGSGKIRDVVLCYPLTLGPENRLDRPGASVPPSTWRHRQVGM
uniref:Uncharacterized protein n=1 Tax=Setaria italica TaxID=4555 RepID=K3Z267_SETIT